MNRLIKTVIRVIGIVLCAIVLILNILCITTIANNLTEKVTIKINSFIDLFLIIIIFITIILITNKLEKKTRTKKQSLKILIIVLTVYFVLQVCWINLRKALPIFDQQNVYETGVAIFESNLEKISNSQYLELYPQQLTLATLYAFIFKILHSTSPFIVQYINAIANCFTILGILFITKQLEKTQIVSYARPLVVSILFITLPLLSTFMYGDILSLPMCLFAIYFIMKYSQKNQIIYAITSALLMAIAYIARMNNLIFIIALTIYLILDILKRKETKPNSILRKIVIILLFIIISFLPATIIKSYWQNKLGLDKNKTFPTLGFICMGMQEGERTNGWYNASVQFAMDDVLLSKQQYKEAIGNRIKIFAHNPLYLIKFYAIKTASMWAESTYAATWYNQSYNFGQIQGMEKTLSREFINCILDGAVRESATFLGIFQKAIILIIFGSTIINLIHNKNNISNEILLLVTIFIGGFLFHTMWEAKSRYIIPYIVVLIPIASLKLDYDIYDVLKHIKVIKVKKITSGENNK